MSTHTYIMAAQLLAIHQGSLINIPNCLRRVGPQGPTNKRIGVTLGDGGHAACLDEEVERLYSLLTLKRVRCSRVGVQTRTCNRRRNVVSELLYLHPHRLGDVFRRHRRHLLCCCCCYHFTSFRHVRLLLLSPPCGGCVCVYPKLEGTG